MKITGLVNVGVNTIQEAFLKRKIIISNQLALIYSLLVIPYIIFTVYYYPELRNYPIFVFVVSLVSLFLNKAGLHILSRLLLACTIAAAVAVYHSFLLGKDESPLLSLSVLQFSLISTPLIIFDLREKRLLAVSLFVTTFLFFIIPYSSGWFVKDLDNTLFKFGLISNLSSVLACVVLISTPLVLVFSTFMSDKKQSQLLSKIENQNNVLVNSQQQLKDYVKEIEKTKENEQNRAWITEGLSKFSSIIRDSNEHFEEHLIKELIQYVEANQGAFFMTVTEEERMYLEMKSCYAYGRKKQAKRRIEIGEGLVGECFREGDIIYLTEIPANYIKIKSGLGDALPRNVIIVPLKFNDSIVGIIEIASFKIFEDHVIDFIKKVSEVVAIQVLNYKASEDAKLHIEKSKLINEKLMAQEEEMRQNMEATQEEMKRKEEEYRKEIERLKSLVAE